jgi:ribonuclease HIII
MPSHKIKLKPAQQQANRQLLDAEASRYRWVSKTEQYCAYRLDGKGLQGWVRVKQYTNGTFYLDAEQAGDLQALCQLLGLTGSNDALPVPVGSVGAAAETALTYPYAGSDESGKGDYFGPLVVAAVLVTATVAPRLKALGIADSKTLTDTGIGRLLPDLVAIVGKANIQITSLMPATYNAQYVQAGSNLNTLLSKTHAHTFRQLLTHADPLPCQLVIDNFGGERKIHAHVDPLGLPVSLATQAESKYVAVAAASCLARHAFVTRMHDLGQQWDMVLPLGAGPGVKQAKAAFIRQHGIDALGHVAKLHFRV